MALFPPSRRHLLSALVLPPLCWRGTPAIAQSGSDLQTLTQPAEKTKAGFLARARALPDQAVKEGDQAYGAVVVRDGVIVGEGRNYVVLHSDPTAHAELLAVRDAAHRLNRRDLFDCDVYSTATPCPMCQGHSIGRAFADITTKARRKQALCQNWHVRENLAKRSCDYPAGLVRAAAYWRLRTSLSERAIGNAPRHSALITPKADASHRA
jgi:tRNA(Arg) A34 adenosine deaminase TadA